MTLHVSSYCSINEKGVYKNGKPLFINKAGDQFLAYAKGVYRELGLSYPKFFKMDELCKLAFLAGEVLLDEQDGIEGIGENVAIVLGNKTSSLATDRKHQKSFENRNDYFPSPAVFVYTLPNIMLGELCIRHKIKGENSCFLMDDFDAKFFNEYVHDLFEEGYKYCITGWVDFQPTKYEAHLLLVSKSDQNGLNLIFDDNLKQFIQ